MAITSIKSTYSLDIDTTSAIEMLAKRWSIPKSQVIRRAIRAQAQAESDWAPPTPVSPEAADRLAAFQALSRSTRERGVDFQRWGQDILATRR